MSELVLSVTNVSKKYCAQSRHAFWYAIYDVLGELRPRRQLSKVLRPGEYWALRDVDLELRRGEALAVIGHNGAGKSTLLKLLFGLLKPDVGEIRIRGRTEALIELGIGINPVLTGRENIRLSAALHGYSALRARRLLDEVSHFAGLGDCLDAPIQSYSSGMKARLSYAVAANLEPDLLLIDEVLAVGDLAFQRKCLNHMRAYLDRGGALLLVSHNTLQVQSICQRALLLERGRVLFSGSAVDALNQMFDSQLADPPQGAEAEPQIGPILIRQLTAEPLRGEGIWSGEAVRIRLTYHSQEQLDVFWGFVVYTGDQAVCVTGGLDPSQHRLTPGAGQLSCVIPRLPLVGGRYVLRGTLLEAHTRHPVAAFGWKNSPTVLDVRQHPCAHANIRMTVQQLMTLDIEWSEEA